MAGNGGDGVLGEQENDQRREGIVLSLAGSGGAGVVDLDADGEPIGAGRAAGHGDGFTVRLDTDREFAVSGHRACPAGDVRGDRHSMRRWLTWDGAELWPRYRAREHELILAPWSPDYLDPRISTRMPFAHNPDNRREANLTGVLAWRNAWASDEISAAVGRDAQRARPRAPRATLSGYSILLRSRCR